VALLGKALDTEVRTLNLNSAVLNRAVTVTLQTINIKNIITDPGSYVVQ